MKTTIKALGISLLIALFAMPVMAQNMRHNQRGSWGDRPTQREPRPRMERMMKISAEDRAEIQATAFSKYIDLSDKQVKQLIAIDLEFAKKMDELKEAALAPDRKKVAMKDMHIEKQLAIHELMSKEQYASFIKNKETIHIEIRNAIRDLGGEIDEPTPDQH